MTLLDRDFVVLEERETAPGARALVVETRDGGRRYLLEELGFETQAKKRIVLEVCRAIDRRAEEIASVSHPALIKPVGAASRGGKCYVATRVFEGTWLDAHISRSGPVDPAAAVEWMITVAEVVAEFHRAGRLMHCLMAEHVVVLRDGAIGVLDPATMGMLAPYRGRGKKRNCYVAPEVVRTGSWARSADYFAFGALFYYVTTGKLPFDDPAPENVTENVLTREPKEPRLHNPAISSEVSEVILAMLEKSPEKRTGAGEGLLQMLKAIRAGKRFCSSEDDQMATRKRTRAAARKEKLERAVRVLQARRAWIGGAILAVLVLAYLLRPVRTVPVVTPQTPAREVVDLYYKSIDQLDMQLVKETIDSKIGKAVIGLVTNLYVMEKVNQAMELQRATPEGKTEMPDLVRVENLGIEQVFVTDSEASFVATYLLTLPSERGPATQPHRDLLRLAKVNGRWRIVELSDGGAS